MHRKMPEITKCIVGGWDGVAEDKNSKEMQTENVSKKLIRNIKKKIKENSSCRLGINCIFPKEI